MIVHRPKLKLKRIKYQENNETQIKSIILHVKGQFLERFRAINRTNPATTSANCLDQVEARWLATFQ